MAKEKGKLRGAEIGVVPAEDGGRGYWKVLIVLGLSWFVLLGVRFARMEIGTTNIQAVCCAN